MNENADSRRLEEIARIRREVIPHPELINARDEFGSTSLQRSIQLEALDLVQALVSRGADVNAAFEDGTTHLLSAVWCKGPDSLRIVEILLDAGADVDAESGWGTPLQVAAGSGDVEKVRLLLKRGASVDRRREREVQETALMEAAHGGHPEVVRILLDHGADPALTNDFGMNALGIAKRASEGFRLEDVDALKRAGLGIEHINLARAAQNENARNGRHAEVIQILEKSRG